MGPSGEIPVEIRPMEDCDIPRCRRIERASFPTHWAWGAFAAELRNPTAFLYVAVSSPDPGATSFPSLVPLARRARPGHPGEIAGYAGAWIMDSELHITVIAVDTVFRRQGIARRMMAHVLQQGRERGASRSTLEVRRGNRAAQRLYLDLGYVIAGVRPGYYLDNGEDAVIMSVSDLWSPEFCVKLRRARRIVENRAESRRSQ